MVPPWVPDAPAPDPSDPASDPTEPSPDPNDPATVQQPPVVGPPPKLAVSPAARFGTARTSLGDFARGNDTRQMHRGISSYSRRGLGGPRLASARLGGAAAHSGALADVLAGLTRSAPDRRPFGLDTASLAGGSARELIDRISRLVSPSDGTQDSEVGQRSVNEALSDLLAREADVDLGALTQLQIEWVLQRHIVYEVFHRIELDVGKSILDNAPNPAAAIDRLDQILKYVETSVAAAFRKQPDQSGNFTKDEVTRMSGKVIRDTFEVFEDFTK